MLHFIKYLLLVIIIISVFLFFQSNASQTLSLNYTIPWIGSYMTIPLPITYLILVSFLLGILTAAFIGALRFSAVKNQKRELQALKNSVKFTSPIAEPQKQEVSNTLPSI